MPLRNHPIPLKIGTAFNHLVLPHDPHYPQPLAREFNLIVPEIAMKCGTICAQQDTYDFTAADTTIRFAQQHRQAGRGHALCWHLSYAPWMKKLTTLELEQTLQQFITTIVSRYRGQCYAWDVVNEALTDDGKLRRSLWSRIEAFIPKCFCWAHQADPDAQLIYLDYRLHKPGRQRAIHKLASDLRADGIPIHGIGLQLYHEASRAIAISQLILPNLIQSFQSLDLSVHCSEVSVPLYPPAQHLPETVKYKLQAQAYSQLLQTAIDHGCESFTVWGFADHRTFKMPPRRDPNSTPSLFDQRYQPKPAYFAVESVLQRAALQFASA